LFVIGAVLAFALNINVGWIDLHLVGYLLMGAGVIVFVIGLVFLLRRRSSTTTVRSAVDPQSGENVQSRTTHSTPDDVI
jgi:nitrate reductase gamma subunit